MYVGVFVEGVVLTSAQRFAKYIISIRSQITCEPHDFYPGLLNSSRSFPRTKGNLRANTWLVLETMKGCHVPF